MLLTINCRSHNSHLAVRFQALPASFSLHQSELSIVNSVQISVYHCEFFHLLPSCLVPSHLWQYPLKSQGGNGLSFKTSCFLQRSLLCSPYLFQILKSELGNVCYHYQLYIFFFYTNFDPQKEEISLRIHLTGQFQKVRRCK